MKAAVLGSPVSHSLSPALHLAAYAALGLAGWSYRAIECDEAGLPGLLAGCGPDWAGLSLTMPLKQAVLPLLDTAEPAVTQLAAANTVVLGGGARHGANTDVAGIQAALTGAGAAGAGPAVILGAGATARAALAALHGLGERAATVAVRDPARAGQTLAAAGRLGMLVTLAPFEPPGRGGYLLISTVPAGAADGYAGKLAAGPAPAAVLDVVYHPWPTRLAAAARDAGAIVVGGFEMLLHQAARQVELMTGQPAPAGPMRAAGQQELRRRARPGLP
ncbi:MAG TPA: shikimate dehydrogenase [Streptosporangiaceae bacterium]|jgi:shikimate dehydrogenase